MRAYHLIIVCAYLCIASACHHEMTSNNLKDQLIRLDVTEDKPYLEDYKSVFSSIDTIILQSNNDCLLGQISSLRIVDSDIYITHNISSLSALFRFSKDGEFLNKIGNTGRGPEEILNPRGFYIEDNKLEVWSQLEMSQFSKEGKYVKRVFKKFYPGVGFFKANGFYYLFHSAAKPYMVSKVRSNGTLIEQFNQNVYIDALSENDKVLFYDNQVSLFCSVFDTVYGFSNNRIIPKAYFNFIKMKSAYEALKESKNAISFINNLNSQNIYCSIQDYFENSTYIIFSFNHNRSISYCLYNKLSNKSVYFKSVILDQLTGTRFCFPASLSDDNNLIIPVYNSIPNKIGNELPQKESLSTINNNPYLLFCKIKSDVE